MCDLAYTAQREEIAARSLAEMQLAPHAKDPAAIETPDQAVASFDDWLNEEPPKVTDVGDLDLESLIMGGRA